MLYFVKWLPFLLSFAALAAALGVYAMQRGVEAPTEESRPQPPGVPDDFLERDIAEQFAIVEAMTPHSVDVEGVGRWMLYDFDFVAFQAMTRGSRPELASHLRAVFDHEAPELEWVGGRVAEQGLSYDGMSPREARHLDAWVRAAVAPDGLWDDLRMRGGALIGQSVLEELRVDPVLAPLLQPLRWGRRPGGERPEQDAYVLFDPTEAAALSDAVPPPLAAEDEGLTELRAVLSRAVADGYGVFAVVED